MNIPENLLYTEDHEWVRIDHDTAYIGITDHAQDSLGDIVYVELPELDTEITSGEEVTSIESVKAASPIYAPMSGVICEVNDELDEKPEQINEDPYGNHIFAIKISDVGESEALLNAEAYSALLEEDEE